MERRTLFTTLWPLAAVKLVVHLSWVTGYGYFRDELYYLACARHLAWGYVDHPPLSVGLLAADTAVFGDSLLAIRWIPALAGAVVVLLTGWLAAQLGGDRRAQWLAQLGVLCAPEYLAIDHFYSMNALDLLGWTAAFCLVARILRAPDEATIGRWAGLGVVLGLGLLNKASVLWLVGGLFVGVVATPHRRLLRTRGPWIALGIAAALVVPHVSWQITHGWPTLEFMRHATEEKMAGTTPLAFLRAQVLDMGPLGVLLWLPGLGALLGWKRLQAFRPLGIAYVAILVLLVVNQKSRAGYLSPAYPALFAAGGVLLEHLTLTRRWLSTGYAVLVAATGAALAPLALPCLPLKSFVAYAAALGQTPSTEEKKDVGRLPQFYADMFGWQGFADAVVAVVGTLEPDERSRAVIYVGNYGEAGALQLFGRGRWLPPVVSGHNSYWLWGPGNPAADVVVRVTGDPDAPRWLREQFESVEPRGTFQNAWVMPYESHLVVYVCRGPRVPWGQSWPDRKHYD